MILLLASGARADAGSDRLLADARAAVAKNPNDQRAWRTVGATSCMKKDRAGAAEALTHLRAGADASLVRRACETNGIDLDAPEEIPPTDPRWKYSSHEPLIDAMDAYVNGRYYDAIAHAALELRRQPESSKAWRVVGGSACYRKDGELAILALRNLDGEDRQFVRYICKRNEIDAQPIPASPATVKEIAALIKSYPPPAAVEPLVP